MVLHFVKEKSLVTVTSWRCSVCRFVRQLYRTSRKNESYIHEVLRPYHYSLLMKSPNIRAMVIQVRLFRESFGKFLRKSIMTFSVNKYRCLTHRINSIYDVSMQVKCTMDTFR